MKRSFLMLFILMIAAFSFAQNGENVVKVIFISAPGVDVYVNGHIVGTIGLSGRLTLSLSIGTTFYVWADSDDFIQVGSPMIIKEDDKVIVFINVKLASYISVVSNTYPVDVFIDGEYYGTVKEAGDEVKIPAGEHELTLKSPGYEIFKKKIAIAAGNHEPIIVDLNPLPPMLKVYTDYKEFSPNGDWYRDTLPIKVYLSREATVTVTIRSEEGRVVWRKDFQGFPGVNELVWDGEGAEDGTYMIEASALNLTSKTTVSLSRKNYTYRKEILLTTLALLATFVGIVVYMELVR